MPEISAERLAELEALETVVQRFVLPQAKYAGASAERERVWKNPRDLTDEEARKLMGGHAMYDDPPKGWTAKQLATWTRGYLGGREVVGMNLSQYFHFIAQALLDPVDFWRRHRLGYLNMCVGTTCSCGGSCTLDEERIGLACDTCHEFYSYDTVREAELQQRDAKRENT